MAKTVLLRQDNRPREGFDPDLALVVTLATNLERLDLPYPK
jgi:hypothetical protein